MLRNKPKQLNMYSILYNRIPKKHILKRINSVIDFSFINKQLESSYCKYYGRPAVEPEIMVRLLIVQYLYNLSDERVIEDTAVNLAYSWFIGINPDGKLPHPSLLAKFRTQRLRETSIDEIITEVVRQCVAKGIIDGQAVSIDTTHVHANTTKLVPERVMKHLAKKIFKNLEEENGKVPDEVDTDIPEYQAIENHREAKKVMKDYLEEVIEQVEETTDLSENCQTKETIEQAKEILKDHKFINQKGIRSLVDSDARVGYKDKNTSFFGYKVETMMISKERIITAVGVSHGAYVDGELFETLFARTLASGLKIKELSGDKAYFRYNILTKLKEKKVDSIIPVSASAYRIDEELYSYNKDSDQWFCIQGNETVKKKYYSHKNGRKGYRYYFSKPLCANCPHRDRCIKKSNYKAKVLVVSLNTNEMYEFSQRAKLPDFEEKFKKRASHEGKNGELKNRHSLSRARGYGLRCMDTQAKLTVLAVNLKRIGNLVSLVFGLFLVFGLKRSKFILKWLESIVFYPTFSAASNWSAPQKVYKKRTVI